MKPIWIALGAVSLLSLGACAEGYGNDSRYGPGYYNQAPQGNYDAYRHYRNDSRYRERRLSREDRVYRGSDRSEEHTSELQSLMRISYAVFCLKKKNRKSKRSRESHTSHTTTKPQNHTPQKLRKDHYTGHQNGDSV